FRDHRRAADTRSRRKIAPPINVHLPKLAGLAVEDRPPRAWFWPARPLEGRTAELAFRGRAHRDNPAQYLDLDAGDCSTVKPAIGRLEQLPDGRSVGRGKIPHRKLNGDLMALTAVAHESRAMLNKVGGGRRTPHDGLGFGAHAGKQAIG